MRKLTSGLAVVVILCAVWVTTSSAEEAASSGKALYAAKCAGCHGADGAKGLKGASYGYVVNALSGYKAQTYGGAKKAMMQAQAAKLSAPEIEALAQFIAGL